MKTMEKSILSVAIAALIIACGFALNATTLANESVTLSWWVVNHNFDTRDAIEETIIPTFEQRNPNIKVEVRYITWGEFSDLVGIAFASGTAPDILQRGADELYTLAWQNQAIPLDRYIEGWEAANDFIPATWDGVVTNKAVGGKVYGLPSLTSPRILYYRRDVFAELGFNPDSTPESWDELLAIAKSAARPNSMGGFDRVGYLLSTSSQYWTDFLRQNGGEMIDPTGRDFTFASQEGVEALEFYVELYTSVRPPGGGWLPPGRPPFMASNHIAMGVSARNAAIQIQQNFPEEVENIGVGYPPGPVRRAASTYTDYWTITTQSRHPDEAWRFLEFLMEPDILVEYNATMGYLPPRKSMITDPYIADDRFARIYMESLLDGVSLPMPVTPLGRSFPPLLNDAIKKAVELREPPKALLEEVARLANANLREAWERVEKNE